MKINKIILNNFGSYEGEVNFNTECKDGKNIILIGGKNGAGKTTLFTAIRLCLYGYMSMGYKSQNSYYNKAIIKLINNTAKIKKPVTTFVVLDISISNGHEYDNYVLTRKWIYDNNISEEFSIEKNGAALDYYAVADFEKYLLSLIPPELFNLYFFDGEKIADFFLNDGGNSRIKDAFLTLCGYDVFDIMRKNFKRVSTSDGESNNLLEEYIKTKEQLESSQSEVDELNVQLEKCINDITESESMLIQIETDYAKKGGITQKEWDEKVAALKEEEVKRERWNAMVRRWANDIVPFIMIRDKLEDVKKQITSENENLKFKNFGEVIKELVSSGDCDTNTAVDLLNKADAVFGELKQSILDLSFEQSSELMAMLNRLLAFEDDNIVKAKKAIKASIKKSELLRKELEDSDISKVQEYMKSKSDILEKKTSLLNEQIELERQLTEKTDELSVLQSEFAKVQTAFENELKKQSINDISAKAIIMLDKLQKTLYRKQISNVEEIFRHEIKTLMRKTKFIDNIFIDDSFAVHIYRNELLSVSDICNVLNANTETQVIAMWGQKAVDIIKNKCHENSLVNCAPVLKIMNVDDVELSIEIDKTSLSQGEKQVFIMALYHALVSLGNHEIPFIIDTPFARIDSEHRRNISKHFFSELNGQVFILSTNEEIDSDHVQLLNNKILVTYMLENTDNSKTTVVSNTYFEEA